MLPGKISENLSRFIDRLCAFSALNRKKKGRIKNLYIINILHKVTKEMRKEVEKITEFNSLDETLGLLVASMRDQDEYRFQ